MNYLEDLHNLHIADTPAAQPSDTSAQIVLKIGKSVNGRHIFVVDRPTALFDNIFAQFQGAIDALDDKSKFVFQHVHQRRTEAKFIKSEYAKWNCDLSVLNEQMVRLWNDAHVYANGVRSHAVASEFFCLHMSAISVNSAYNSLKTTLEADTTWLEGYKLSPESTKKSVAREFLANVVIEPPLQPTLQYVKDSESYNKLPAENCFRTGTTGASTYWWSIKGHTDALTNIAKALHKLEGEHKDLLRRVCQGEANGDQAATMHQVALGLTSLVYEQIKALISIADRSEPHAGLDYANALVEQGKALSVKCLELATFTKHHMNKVRQALDYLKAVNTVDGLYDAISFIRDLSCEQTDCRMLYEVLEHTLIKISHDVCVLTNGEKSILEHISANEPLEDLERDLKFYLMKRLITNIFFCENLEDSELDCVLYILQTDAVYRSRLGDILGLDGALRQLYNSYVAYAKLASQKDVHAAMKTILGLLQITATTTVEEKYVRIRKAEEALHAFEQKIDAAHPKWIFVRQSFLKRKEEWDKDVAIFKKCDNEGQIILYGHLSSCLFSHSAEIRAEAEKSIIRIVNQTGMIQARIPEGLQFLLKLWAIKRLVAERTYCREHTLAWGAPSLTKYEQVILEKVLTEYLTIPDKRLFWHSLYDIGFMELLVHDYRSKYESFVTHGSRSEKNFPITKTVLDIYRKFRDLVEKDMLFNRNSNKPTEQAQDLYMQLKECFDKKTDIKAIEITDPKEYGEVSLYLLRQIHNFIHSKQSTF